MGRMEEREMAGEQKCPGRSQGREGDGHSGDRPEDRGHGGVSGTERRTGTSGGRPRKSSAGEREPLVEQVAHASGVARRGGRGKRPQDRGQAAADPGHAERGGAARWWPGGQSGGGLKSQGRPAQGTNEELPRGPGGRKPASWSMQRGAKTRGRMRPSSTCQGGGWKTGTAPRCAEMCTKVGT